MNSVHSYGFVGENPAVRMRERGSGIGSKTSMQPMAYSLKAMEITRERVYELMELLD